MKILLFLFPLALLGNPEPSAPATEAKPKPAPTPTEAKPPEAAKPEAKPYTAANCDGIGVSPQLFGEESVAGTGAAGASSSASAYQV